MTHDAPRPPDHLSAESQTWWRQIVLDFDFEAHHLKLLQVTCEAWDRAQQARRIVDDEGAIITDRFGQKKPHPATFVERDNRALFARMLRELSLDVSEPSENRPPAHSVSS